MDPRALTPRPRRWRRRLAWIGGGLLVALVAIGLAARHALPPLLRDVIAARTGEFLGREVELDSVAFDPLRLVLTLQGLRIREPDATQPFVAIDRIEADLHSSSLWHRGPVLEALRISAPRARIARSASSRFNFSDIVETIARRPRSPKPLPFSLRDFRIEDGHIEFDDRVHGVKHTFANVEATLPLLSRLAGEAEDPVQLRLAALADGAPLTLGLDGRLLVAPVAFTVRLGVKDLPVARLLPHAALDPTPDLGAGTVSADLRLVRGPGSEGQPASLTLAGEAEARDLVLSDARGAVVAKAARLAIDLESADLRERRVNLSRVLLAGAEVEVVREADGRMNLARLLPRPRAAAVAAQPTPPASAQGERAEAPARPRTRVAIASIEVENGRVGWTDRAVSPPFTARAEAIGLSIRGLEPGSETPAEARGSLRTARGETLELDARLQLSPLLAEGRLALAGVRIPDYAPYFASKLPVRIESATLSGSSGFRYASTGGKPALALSGLALDLRGLRARRPEASEPLLQLQSLALAEVDIDLAARQASVGSIRAREGALRAMLGADGRLDLATMRPAGSPAPAPANPPTGGTPAPWTWSLRDASLERWAIRLEDRRLPQPAIHELSGLDARLAGLNSRPGSRGQLRLRTAIDRGGSLAIRGDIGLSPGFANVEVDLASLGLVPLQPYFGERLNVLVTSGEVGLRGRVQLDAATRPLRGRFAGDLRLSGLGVLDRGSEEELLRIGSLQVSSVDARMGPGALDIGEIALSDFAARLILSKDGRLSLREMVRPAPGASPVPASAATAARPDPAGVIAADAQPAESVAEASRASAAPRASPAPRDAERMPIRIGRISVVSGTVNYSDFLVRPNYRVNLTGVTGTVSELSSQPGTTAEIDLRAAVDGTAPVQIAGRLNPLAAPLFVDIKASMRGAELSTLSPYTIKYTGYGIERGRLTIETAYRVEDRKLDAQHRVFLDQLTFSADRVDGPAVLRLPILFAVRLLQNRNGEIDLTLPVTGTLDDPKFRLGPIIWQVVVNLVTRIVTAPFALFSRGGSEDLSYVAFAPGSPDLDEAGRSRLASVGKGLAERPSVRLELSGRVDPEADRAALRRLRLEASVRAQVARDRVRRGEAAPPLAELVPTREEYESALRAVYRQAPIARPRNAVGLLRDLPVPEMETLLVTASRVTDEDLRELAAERARAVEAWLVKDAGLPPERIFRVPAADQPASAAAKRAASRVDLLLR